MKIKLIWRLLASLAIVFQDVSCGKDTSFNDEKVLQLPKSYDISWMSSVENSKVISELTIPGTHDTMALYGGPAAECQAWSLEDQLRAGIRYLDLRVFSIDDKLYVMHGVMYEHTTFIKVLETIKAFLAEFKTEAVLVRVKPDLFNKADVEKLVQKIVEFDEDVWIKSAVPTMGEIRGKIVFVQKLSFKLGLPLVGTDKKDDYKVTNILDKEIKIEEHLNEAEKECGRDYLVLSYSSGTGIGTLKGMFLTPKKVAKNINPWFYEYLKKLPHDTGTCFGIIAMDFPGLALIQTVINLN
ncbi:uncharacterized protein LOC114790990 [Denticeps clupeoides]|uniref:Phosphatidylinositol-specific phospholipase C X domain-containing protein n=1 Tax=Denticeps clupeoides TaxID=299321 RepID=A0AAY4DU42_9TELE|nr:uncharacterized protein LOC114790990 [Denticeps clupeoides]